MSSKIKILFDTNLNYHPQYDDYKIGEPIKQADTIMVGYPLNYPMPNNETLLNDLNIYANVTRSSGPAMTWSMYAINYLRLKKYQTAKKFFQKGYLNYVRKPFYVWHEVKDPLQLSASNFLTGAGGFLQSVLYGYGGIQLNHDSFVITNSKLPPETKCLKVNGINYLGISFDLIIMKMKIVIQVVEIRIEDRVAIVYNGITEIIRKTNARCV